MPSDCTQCGIEVVNRIVHRLPANDDMTSVEERARMKALQREAEREKESSGNGTGAEPHGADNPWNSFEIENVIQTRGHLSAPTFEKLSRTPKKGLPMKL